MPTADPSADKSAFRQAMEAQRPRILEQIVEKTLQTLPFPPRGGRPNLEKDSNENIGRWFDAVETLEFTALEAKVIEWCSVFQSFGFDGSIVLALVEDSVDVFLDAALQGIEEGAPGAEEWTRGLLQALSHVTKAYDTNVRARADEGAKRALLLRTAAEAAPLGIGVAKPAGDIVYTNSAYIRMMGTEDAKRGTISDFVHPEERERFAGIVETAHQNGKWDGPLRYQRADGTTFNAHLTAFRAYAKTGTMLARCAILRDLTDEEKHRDELRRLAEQIVEAQAHAIEELGTPPLMPLAKGVLAMPLVGTINEKRAQKIIEVMLDGIVTTSAGHVIMDITGVPAVTDEIADAITRAAKAAELVGAEVVLTGIRGAVAKTLVEFGVSLDNIETWSTLRAGVAHAIAHEHQKIRHLEARSRP